MTSVNYLLNTNNFKPTNKPVREGFAYIDTTDPSRRAVPTIERIAPMDRTPVEVLLDKSCSPDQPLTMTLQQKFGRGHDHRERSFREHIHGPDCGCVENNHKPGCTPVTDMLLPETSTMVYTDEFFEQPNAKLFLQNVQPNIFSYAVDTTPINSLASGITYTPQIPPKFRDQVYNRPDGTTYPIYTRIDPQLIRDDGVPARLLEQPIRGDWSAKYSSWEAPPGSVNYEDIYDGRFTGYGDPYRSYSDVQLGNVSYYSSDIDAYRQPNFITRSKVDFIEYTDPMGKVKPYYERTAGMNDARPFVENQWMNDSLYFRESISESNMRPALARNWQTRYMPLSKAGHTRYFTSGAT